ncbi:hypothetical protein C4588_06525 [Candidatus Parcubacteria bacterium]|nr:MAG: hypothetical protein C4588_06525 [Candidatus Parcubacteria bacterium]
MTCYGSQCPPPSAHNFTPQFYPGIPELSQYPSSDEAEAAAKQINADIQKKIQDKLQKAQSAGDQASATSIKEIYDDLMTVDQWVKSVQPPFKEAPMVLPSRSAEKLVDAITITTPSPPPIPTSTPTQAMPMVTPTSVPPSAPTVTAPRIYDEEPIYTEDIYSTEVIDTSRDQSGVILLLGGAAFVLLTLTLIIRKVMRRKEESKPSKKRRKRK